MLIGASCLAATQPATPASAQSATESAPTSRPASRTALAPTTVAETETAGYQGRPADERGGSLLGGLVGLGPGFFVHGLGHAYVGEEATAWALFGAELVGLALMATGGLFSGEAKNSGEEGPLRRALLHSGTLLFLGSFTADVLGAFKGSEPFSPDSTRTEGAVFSIAYRYANDPKTQLRHHLVAGLEANFQRLSIRPSLDLETALDERRYALDVGLRVLKGHDPHDHLELGARGRRLEIPAEGAAARSLEGYAKWKVNLGHIFRTTRGLFLVNRLALGLEQYQLAAQLGDTPPALAESDFDSPYLALSSGLEVNTGKDTHLALAFVQDSTAEVAAAGLDSGFVELRLEHRYGKAAEIQVELQAGDGWSAFLGVGYAL